MDCKHNQEWPFFQTYVGARTAALATRGSSRVVEDVFGKGNPAGKDEKAKDADIPTRTSTLPSRRPSSARIENSRTATRSVHRSLEPEQVRHGLTITPRPRRNSTLTAYDMTPLCFSIARHMRTPSGSRLSSRTRYRPMLSGKQFSRA